MPEREIFILPGLRSPFTKVDKELGRLDAVQLSVPVVQQTVVGPAGPGPGKDGKVDLIVWGSVIPTLSVSNWAREVWLDAGLEPHVPAHTIIQACGTSLAGATHAAGQVSTGAVDLALVGGVESMSNTQIGLSRELSRTIRRAAGARGPGDALSKIKGLKMRDIRLSIPGITERSTGRTMGQHTEEMAKDWGIPREEQDQLALDSHQRSVAGAAAGFFRPLLVSTGTYAADGDTIPRADTSLEKLAQLRPVFDRENGTLSAGNSSPLTDGAAACWVASGRGAARISDSAPRARLVDWEEAATDPKTEGLLIAPALAIPRLLERNGLGYGDIALWEVHEAFAAQVLVTIKALESSDWLRDRAGVERDFGPFPRGRMNPNGGSIALGHPFAATGARILSQTVRELADMPAGSKAVVSICAAGGQGNVALLEAV
ncbi:MAG: acetyl-CoA C-acyltransferase [Gemmatimonadota bacterium]